MFPQEKETEEQSSEMPKKKRLASPHGREKTPGNKRVKGNSHRRAGSVSSYPSSAAGAGFAGGGGSDDSRVSGDGDCTIAMDEDQGSPRADPAMEAGEAWDESMPFHRDEFVRVISSCLRGLGYGKASKVLEEESGCRADLDESTPSLLSCVSAGRWEQALTLLASVSFSSKSLHVQARALLLRQRFLELVEDRRLEDALTCLREEIAPLFSRREIGDRGGNVVGAGNKDDDILGSEQLHALSALLLAPTAVSLRRLSSPGKAWVSRLAARSDTRVALQGLLARGGRAVAPGRLEHLVSQALRLQIQECDYHNILPQKMPLTEDHSCGLRALPQVTTHVLDEHGDEVWCCQFSNGGGMLATSSADGVLLLWNLDGSRERDGRCSPEMHKRITVREGPPHCIAWSPDDSSILASGASPVVTRWDVASGEEMRAYRGVHEEGVTGVAWLRDGRGFVTSSLDRKVVVWNLGGTVLSVWKCHWRITGIVVTSTPLEATPLSHLSFDDHLTKHYQYGVGFRGTALSSGASSGADAALSSRHRVLANRAISNGRGGDATPSSPTPSASRSRPLVNPLQAGARAGTGAVSGRRSPAANSSNLRRCRVWAIIKEDTIKALDVEVMEYGESSEPSQGGDDGGSGHINGSANDGVGAGGGGSDRARDGRNSGVRQEDGGSSDARRRRNGVDTGGGGGGSGSVCPRSSPSRRKAASCKIEEGPEECFDKRIITGVCAARDGSDLLLLHTNTGRILSWNTITRKVFKRYHGHRQLRYIVRSTFGGLNDGFVASGSEDSLVYLWHRKSGELFAALPGHAGTVNSVHWNPARPGMLASVSDDHTVRLWAPALPEPPLSILPHSAGESVRDDGIPASPNGITHVGISTDAAGEGSGRSISASGSGKDGGRVVIGPLSPHRGGSGDRGVAGGGAQLKREAGTEAFLDGCGGSGISGRGPLSGKGQGWVQQGSRGLGSAGVDGEPPETRERRSSAYRRGQSPGLEAWEKGEGHRDRYHEIGFSAKIAALRW